jgi:diaminohydroxyphosphoribosylaminopyrimidine deaminase/5-amino-6-(5-phosphoribosylamino)uracil reductase
MRTGHPAVDASMMEHALALGGAVRGETSPNPWVGAVVVGDEGVLASGATEPPGGRHAEVVALDAAGARARGATLYVTLEPCSHVGRTPACTGRIIEAGVRRVVVGVEDPDAHVRGSGLAALRAAGVDVTVGVLEAEVRRSLAPYLHHRSTGRPYVVLKWAQSLDGRIAAADGSSKWITSEEARRDAHALRAACDAILVGAGTVRADDPALTVRLGTSDRQPLRVVLGHAPPGARVQPCVELSGPLADVLDELGARGVLQLLVEGGASVAHEFVEAGLVDRFVVYIAPVLFGGDDGAPALRGPGAPTIADVARGRFVSVVRVGEDLRVEVETQ